MWNASTSVLLQKLAVDPALTYQRLCPEEAAALPSAYRKMRAKQSFNMPLFTVLVFLLATILGVIVTRGSGIGSLVVAVALTVLCFVYYRVTRSSREFARLTPEVSFDRVRLWALERERQRYTKRTSYGTGIVLIIIALAAVVSVPDQGKQEAALREEIVKQIKTQGGSGFLATASAEVLRNLVVHNDLNCTGMLDLQYRYFYFGSALTDRQGHFISVGMFGHVFFFSGNEGNKAK